jgi:primosomal protein N''
MDDKTLSDIEKRAIQQVANEEALEQQPNTELTQEELNAIEEEAQLEKEFGDSPLRTFAESAASAATFGVSDQVLKKFVGSKALRERRERNEEAAITGEIAGIAAPAFLSGGTSLAAKGAQTAGAGVLAASKAGQITEKALAQILKKTGKEKLARSVVKKSIEKGAGSAVEGAFYGTGQLVSEEALGTAEFNAENLLANVGAGAAFGAAAGGLFGSAEALIPVVKKGKIADYAVKKVPQKDINKISAELSGFTPSKITKLKQNNSFVYENLGDYYKNRLKLNVKDNTADLFEKNQRNLQEIGEEIGDTLAKIDDIADNSVLTTRDSLAKKITTNLEDLRKDFEGVKSGSARRKRNRINKEIEEFQDWIGNREPVSAKELNDLKRKYQNLSKYDKELGKTTLEEQINRTLAKSTREEVLDLADRVSTVNDDLGQQLRKQNLDYSTAAELTEVLSKKVDKVEAQKFLKFKDMLLGNIFLGAEQAGIGAVGIAAKKFAESDLRRKLQILSSVEKANKSITKNISTGVKDFFTKAKTAAKPTSTKVLLSTTFNTEGKSKKSENKKKAFDRISKELNELVNDRQKLINHITKNNLRVTNTAPNTANIIDQTMVKMVDFLYEKMPKPTTQKGMIQMLKKKPNYTPSTLELAKFERYVEGATNPMSIVDDLKAGNLSREKIEAVQVLYPDLYRRIQTETLSYIEQNADNIAYPKRLQLGILLDIAADTSLVPENIARLQETFRISEERNAGQDGAVNTTQGGLENLNMAEDLQTDVQKTENF